MPVRAVLRQSAKGKRRVRVLPYAPWNVAASAVVVPAGEALAKSTGVCSSSHCGTNSLKDIIMLMPMREAFGEFCRKALCSEVSASRRVAVRAARLAQNHIASTAALCNLQN